MARCAFGLRTRAWTTHPIERASCGRMEERGELSWTSGDAVLGDVRLHYYRTGGPGPVVVLWHGFSDSGLSWLRVAHALAVDFEVVAPDARGGRSEAGRALTAAQLEIDSARFISQIGCGPVAVVGHSMGAMTAA